MDKKHLPFDAPLAGYEQQAAGLLAAHNAREAWAIEVIHRCHPRFLDADIKWKPRELGPDEIEQAAFDLGDARLTVARGYDFLDWASLAAHVAEVTVPGSRVARFEAAVEAVIDGDETALAAALAADPELVQARSARVTHFDPPLHRAMLLHYVAANGTEGYRQRTPKNAPAIARMLLRAGAEPDSLANLYGGECTAMSLLVSSCHPAEAGVQAELVDVLVDHGAPVERRGSGNWTSPLTTALVFGYRKAADALVRRGARVDSLAAAAGLGLVEEARALLAAGADADERHRALALAAHLGETEAVRLLLDAGEDPDRFNPPGMHAHATPLHHAALGGHEGVVRLLLERGARRDIEDTLWHGTPAGWARHGGYAELARLLEV